MYLTAPQAAARLGVKRPTLYTYVSRGWIRTVPGRNRRERCYLAADIDALRLRADAAGGAGAAAASALDWGPPVLASGITSIDVDGPNYRGVPALTLAEQHRPFEATVHLLWSGALVDDPPPLCAPGALPEALAELVPAGSAPLPVLGAVAPILGLTGPSETDDAAAGALIRRLVAALSLCGPRSGWQERAADALAAPTVAHAVCAALGAPSASAALVDQALILCADHELNASTFAARVAASTGATVWAAVTAALATLGGSRHGGMSDHVEEMISAAAAAADPTAWVEARLARGAAPPGFGHRLYVQGDPRGAHLLAASGGGSPVLSAVVAAMAAANHPPPSLDVGLVAIRRRAGLPLGSAGALFAVGRCAGWIAHAREQRAQGRLLRPRARYVGP